MNPVPDPASLPLRDIHLPTTVSWWPPAPGWWLLLLLVLFIYWLAWRWIRQRRLKQQSVAVLAQQELRRIRDDYERSQDKTRLVRDLSELLRRTSISLFPRQESASLTGAAWLEFLDRQTGETHFTRGEGHVLIEAPYRDNVDYDAQALLQHVEAWLHKVIKGEAGPSG